MSRFVVRYATDPMTIRIATGTVKPTPIFLATVQLIALPSSRVSPIALTDLLVDDHAGVADESVDVQDGDHLGRHPPDDRRADAGQAGRRRRQLLRPDADASRHRVGQYAERHPARLHRQHAAPR